MKKMQMFTCTRNQNFHMMYMYARTYTCDSFTCLCTLCSVLENWLVLRRRYSFGEDFLTKDNKQKLGVYKMKLCA